MLIGEVLPRAKLKLELYRTEAMLEAVARLYAQIMRFSQRAIKWYTNGKLKHVYHSVMSVCYADMCVYKDVRDDC